MNNIFFTVLLLVMSSAVIYYVVNQNNISEEINWTTYVNEDYGYQIDYPATAEIRLPSMAVQDESAHEMQPIDKIAIISGGEMYSILISVQENVGYSSLADVEVYIAETIIPFITKDNPEIQTSDVSLARKVVNDISVIELLDPEERSLWLLNGNSDLIKITTDNYETNIESVEAKNTDLVVSSFKLSN